MSDNTSRVGDLAEHKAVVWLWQQGYEVFRNCGCTGPVDLIAMDKHGSIVLIDVKTRRLQYETGNHTKAHGRTDVQKELGVHILGYDSENDTFKFVEHRDETTYTRHRDKQHPQLNLDCCDAGC